MIWDIASGKSLATLSGQHHQKMISSLDFNVDGNILASGSLDNAVCIWDFKELASLFSSSSSKEGISSDSLASTCLVSLKTKKTPIYSLHFTLRNLLLVAGPYLPNNP
jgi:transcription initiation factor TFIID subunit 5